MIEPAAIVQGRNSVQRRTPGRRTELQHLLLDQIRVAGYALPLAVQEHPGVGEASIVLEGLALVRSLGVISSDYDGHVRIRNDSRVVIGDQGGAVVFVR